jgi:hypothetical protein
MGAMNCKDAQPGRPINADETATPPPWRRTPLFVTQVVRKEIDGERRIVLRAYTGLDRGIKLKKWARSKQYYPCKRNEPGW